MKSSLSLTTVWYKPQSFIDGIGMYRVVSGGLGVLAALSLIAGHFGFIAYRAADLAIALVLAVLTALALNSGLSRVTGIHVNNESALITALILFFLAIPAESVIGNWPLIAAVVIAVLSKFIFVFRKQHIANPAAIGAVALGLPGFFVFSWWVANPVLFIPLVILGAAVVMKVRKWSLIGAFISVGLVTYLFESWRFGEDLFLATETFFVSWPTLFLAAFMLTEPFTMPGERWQQIVYGAGVGFLANTTLFMPVVSMSPELALVIGNIAVVPWRLRQKLFLTLEEKRLIAKDTYEFSFKKPVGFSFKAGQYLEWMLPHSKSDKKGIRRYFTIASSPTESSVRVAMKITQPASSYKTKIQSLDIDQPIIASQLAGDFLLPPASEKKLGFIAGGIGVTPFRSHITWMLDSGRHFDTTLYYCVQTSDELAYRDVFEEAKSAFGLVLIPVVAKEAGVFPAETGFITGDMLLRRTPDVLDRVWYISGPPAMVRAYKDLLLKLGVRRSQIKTDFFPGVA